jgi:tetratricopeptide (TPR) repeat protein
MASQPDNSAFDLMKAHTIAADGTEASLAAAADAAAKGLTKRNVTWETRKGAAGQIQSAYAKDGTWDKAIAAMDGWVKAHPNDSAAWWWHGDTLFRASKADKAAESFEKSWKVSKETLASSARSAGYCYWRLACPPGANGAPDYSNADKAMATKAFQWFATAYGVKGWDWTYAGSGPDEDLENLFVGLQSNGHEVWAAEQVEKVCLPLAPDCWRLLNIAAFFNRGLGEAAGGSKGKEIFAKSTKYYVDAAKAVEKDASAPAIRKAQVLNDTGLMFSFPQYQNKDIEKGMDYYRRALAADPTFGDANENLGLCLNSLGKFEEAVPYFEKVLAADPTRRVSRGGLERARQGLKKD